MKFPVKIASILLVVTLSLMACQNQGSVQDDLNYREPTQEEINTYAAAFRSFGFDPDGFDFYIYYQASDIMTESERLGITSIVSLQSGDYVPAFFWDENEETLYAIKKDRHGDFYLYTVQRNPDSNSVEPDCSDLWLQVEETRVLPKP